MRIMKKYLSILVVFFALPTFSQVSNELKIDEIKCDAVNFDSATQYFVYLGNVSFKNNIIEFKNAEKIVHDKNPTRWLFMV